MSCGEWWIGFFHESRECYGGLDLWPDEPHTGYMNRSGVLPEHRGNRLQLRLIRARENHARRTGLTRIISDTTDNTTSANTLITAGYRLYRPENPWAFKDSLYWHKDF